MTRRNKGRGNKKQQGGNCVTGSEEEDLSSLFFSGVTKVSEESGLSFKNKHCLSLLFCPFFFTLSSVRVHFFFKALHMDSLFTVSVI